MAQQQEYDYDLIVVGGGSGGLAAAKEAARAQPGLRVACFDFVDPSPQGTSWGLGGTCVNVGCIPKKLFHGAGNFSHAMAHARNLGWQLPGGGGGAGDAEGGDDVQMDAASESGAKGGVPHDWAAMVRAVTLYIRSLNFAYAGSLRSAGVEYINGKARFVDAHTVEFVRRFKKDVERKTAARFILAPGGRPMYPDGVPGARELGITSDDIFWRKQAPGKTLVVGASYIALECAGFLHGLGYDTTVMVRSILLRGFDQQVASQIGEAMERSGVRFVRPAVPVSLRRDGDEGPITVEYRAADGSVSTEQFDTVLFATGRTPNTADLGLEAAGVATDDRGQITVDEEERSTSAPHVWAVGDAIAGPPGATARPELTPVAIQAGQLLARRLYGGEKARMDYGLVPTTVFTPLEYGACGMSQEEAEAKFGTDAECYVSRFNALEDGVGDHHRPKLRSRCFVDENLWARQHAKAHGQEWEDFAEGTYEYDDRAGQYSHNNLLAKLVVNKADNDRVVGFHYLGPQAGEITQGFALAMRCGATKEQFDQVVGIHPTLAEEFTVMGTTLASGDNFMKKEGCGGGGSCG